MSGMAWLAGWYEARGSVLVDARDSLNRKTGYIVRKDKFAVIICGPRRLLETVESMCPGARSRGTELRIHSQNAADFLMSIRPHMRLRGEEVDSALMYWSYFKSTSGRGNRISEEVRKRRNELAMAVSAKRKRRVGYAEARRRAREMREAVAESLRDQDCTSSLPG